MSFAKSCPVAKPRAGNGARPQWEDTAVMAKGMELHECSLLGMVLEFTPTSDQIPLALLRVGYPGLQWPRMGLS